MNQYVSVESLFDFSSFSHSALFEGCAYPWEALERLMAYFQAYPLGEKAGEVSPEAILVDPASIFIGHGSVVEAGAYIQGPCILGEGCVVRSGAYIRGAVIAGEGCVIGHGTEIKHSILLEGVCAAHFNYIGDSILGARVNMGAGVKCANFRLDHQPISVLVDGRKFETGLTKLGALIGDGAQVGCNCVLNPGTWVGKKAFCFPTLSIYGYVPDGARVKPSQKNLIEIEVE